MNEAVTKIMFEDFKQFILHMRDAAKAREIGMVSITDFYFYQIGRIAWNYYTCEEHRFVTRGEEWEEFELKEE